MNNDCSEENTLHRRVEKLERQNRAFKGLATAAVVFMIGAGFLAGQQPAEKTLEANRFVLKDEGGNLRAALEMVEGGPMLRLFDSAGRPRIVEAVTVIGSSIGMLDAAGKPRAALGSTLTGEPTLTLFDDEGKPRCALAAPNGIPGMILYDANRKQRLAVNLNSSGTPTIALMDTNGKGRIAIGVAANGDGTIGIADENGTPRVGIGRGAYGDGVAIIGPSGKPAAALSFYASGSVNENALTFFDLNGKPRATIGTATNAGTPRIGVLDAASNVLWKVP